MTVRDSSSTSGAERPQGRDYDVLIAGGGLAGLTLALQILQTRPDTRVAVIERASFPVTESAHKVGEATVENGAHYFREVLGLADHLDHHQIRKLGLRFFMSDGDNRSIARRLELGSRRFLPSRTYQLDRGRFENELARRVTEAKGEIYDGTRVARIELDADGGHLMRVVSEETEHTLSGRWIVDASGRRALLKQKLGLAQANDHDVNAVWFRLNDMIRIDDFIDCDDPPTDHGICEAWRQRVPSADRWRSTNHLMGPGYWAWLIPLASGSVSVGIVADESLVPFTEINSFEKALAWLHANEPQVAEAVEQRREGLQDFRMLRHYSHGCRHVYSGERWCITGEAGAFLDPLYSPGSDFIALSNTYVCDLIMRDLQGENIAERAARYDAAYLGAYEAALNTWLGQYPLMGNPQVWAAKTAWDTLTYFAILNLLYVNGALYDLEFMESVAPTWRRYSELAERMQRFLREWALIDDGKVSPYEFVDLSEPLYERLNGELLTRLRPTELRERLQANVALVEELAVEMFRGVALRQGVQLDAREIDPMTFELQVTLSQPPGDALDAPLPLADGTAVDALKSLWKDRHRVGDVAR